MAKSASKKYLLLNDGEELTVERCGSKVQFNAKGGIDIYGSAPLALHPPVNEGGRLSSKTKGNLQVGKKMKDGSVFGGFSPNTGKPMYVRPADEPLTMRWKEAMEYAARFVGPESSVGTFRVPTAEELNVLFKNRDAIGGFNKAGGSTVGWYGSSTQNDNNRGTRAQRFSDGVRHQSHENNYSSIRLIRN
ncbi:hypothetical protein [Xanthobacter autotrophicus]|uniref:hypothetical protein n=1 Tax=Xanthobacter autotrophicus TaxID=280 RepID=UPI00372AA970